jgi:hypothetical protein
VLNYLILHRIYCFSDRAEQCSPFLCAHVDQIVEEDVFGYLVAGIEPNPGPVNTNSSTVIMELINARLMVNKSALIHDLVNDHHLDVVAVTETEV